MAVRDTAPYLPRCLNSILNQTYENWELIAINDHSSDSSLKILEDHAKADTRIKVHSSDRKKLIPTLKYGYKYAQGELINRMDSDDYMPLNKLELLVSKWQEYGKGNIIAGGTEHFVDNGQVGAGFKRYDRWLNQIARTSTHYMHIYKECVIPSHCWIIHKEDFDSVLGFEPEVYPEDYDLCFRFYRKKLTIVGIPNILHYWRDRENRISRTWVEYKDNRYFEMKTRYFFELDRNTDRPLVLWGAGKNGKDLAKNLQQFEQKFHWVCDTPSKIGHEIYGIKMQATEEIASIENPQILIAVASPNEIEGIRERLSNYGKTPVSDYWEFL